jgi:hypothetical protein
MVTVTYTCPRCGAVVELDRGAYLADKCVTPHPVEGWSYVPAYEVDPEPAGDDATDAYSAAGDGVELVCGASETRGEGCGEPFYLSFVRHEDGREVDPQVALGDAVRFEFGR